MGAGGYAPLSTFRVVKKRQEDVYQEKMLRAVLGTHAPNTNIPISVLES